MWLAITTPIGWVWVIGWKWVVLLYMLGKFQIIWNCITSLGKTSDLESAVNFETCGAIREEIVIKKTSFLTC